MANPHYHMILLEDLPHMAREVERVLLTLACRHARNNNIHQVGEIYRAYRVLTPPLEWHLLKAYNEVDVLHKIIQIRDLFIRFKRYIHLLFVEYDMLSNYAMVSPEYPAVWEGGGEPQYARDFRIHGLPSYNLCKFFFVTCRTALYYFEPRDLAAEEVPIGDSNNEDNSSSDDEGNPVEEEPEEEGAQNTEGE